MDPGPFTPNVGCAPAPGEDRMVKATFSLEAGCQKFIQIVQRNRSLGEGGGGRRWGIMRGNVVCLNEAKRI